MHATVDHVFTDPEHFLEDGGVDLLDHRHC
jgi:hypothetical protein